MIMNRSSFTLLALASVGLVLSGCSSTSVPPPPHFRPLAARFFLEARTGDSGLAVVLPQSRVTLTLVPKPILMEFDVTDAEIAEVPLGRCLLFRLTPAAARDLYRQSGAALGRRLVLTLNDEVVGARRIDQALGEGPLVLFIEKPDQDLPELVERLKGTSRQIQRDSARQR